MCTHPKCQRDTQNGVVLPCRFGLVLTPARFCRVCGYPITDYSPRSTLCGACLDETRRKNLRHHMKDTVRHE